MHSKTIYSTLNNPRPPQPARLLLCLAHSQDHSADLLMIIYLFLDGGSEMQDGMMFVWALSKLLLFVPSAECLSCAYPLHTAEESGLGDCAYELPLISSPQNDPLPLQAIRTFSSSLIIID